MVIILSPLNSKEKMMEFQEWYDRHYASNGLSESHEMIARFAWEARGFYEITKRIDRELEKAKETEE